MKFKFTTLMIASTVFLASCSESDNKAPQQKSQAATAIKTQPVVTPTQEKKPTLTANQPKVPKVPKETAPQNKAQTAQEKLTQEAKSLAAALAYEKDETPQKQIELEIKEVLEAVMADLPETEKGASKY